MCRRKARPRWEPPIQWARAPAPEHRDNGCTSNTIIEAQGLLDPWASYLRELHPRMLRHQLLPIRQRFQPVDRGEIRQRRGFEDVGAQAAAADFGAVML